MLKRISVVALTVTLLFGFSMTAFADIRADARKYYRTGMALLKSGKVDDGVEALEKAFSLMPHPNTLLTLARVFEQLKDWERSIHYYERYLEFDPIDKADVQELIANMKLKLNPKPATPASAGAATNAEGRQRRPPPKKPRSQSQRNKMTHASLQPPCFVRLRCDSTGSQN